jgi:hypothetical protein
MTTATTPPPMTEFSNPTGSVAVRLGFPAEFLQIVTLVVDGRLGALSGVACRAPMARPILITKK